MKYLRQIPFMLLLLLSSCGSLSNIDVSYDDDAELKSIRGSRAIFAIPATVDNPTGYVLKVKKVELNIYRKGHTYAELSLPRILKVPSHTNRSHELLLEIYFKNPLALIKDDFEFDIEDEMYTLEGYIKVGVGLFSKKYQFEELTFNQLVSRLENL